MGGVFFQTPCLYIYVYIYTVQLERNSNLIKLSSWIYFAGEYHYTLRLIRWLYIYAPPWGLSTLAKELSAAARIMQSSSKELSTLVADRVLKCKQTDATAVAK